MDNLNDRFYRNNAVNLSVDSSLKMKPDRLKKKFILDEREISKRSKIIDGLRSSPDRIIQVSEIADSFERLTNS